MNSIQWERIKWTPTSSEQTHTHTYIHTHVSHCSKLGMVHGAIDDTSNETIYYTGHIALRHICMHYQPRGLLGLEACYLEWRIGWRLVTPPIKPSWHSLLKEKKNHKKEWIRNNIATNAVATQTYRMMFRRVARRGWIIEPEVVRHPKQPQLSIERNRIYNRLNSNVPLTDTTTRIWAL